jgi:hypothetical protein
VYPSLSDLPPCNLPPCNPTACKLLSCKPSPCKSLPCLVSSTIVHTPTLRDTASQRVQRLWTVQFRPRVPASCPARYPYAMRTGHVCLAMRDQITRVRGAPVDSPQIEFNAEIVRQRNPERDSHMRRSARDADSRRNASRPLCISVSLHFLSFFFFSSLNVYLKITNAKSM